ncbi:syntaxin-18-like [Saccostrea echinata]|uniref:syntaxin-18-like n=1 Tax=Saccostrea echinata TaxID=191078 RepID=UPI002A80C314|nr:syntaxin-18-like [Saccostrea echinata]
MADITNVFKATVKALRTRKKFTGDGQKSQTFTNILPSSKHKGDFERKSKEIVQSITKLKDFLLEHRKAYVSTGSHLSAETSTMSDTERDQIDEEAEKVIHMCQESLSLIKNLNGRLQPQTKEHRAAVIRLVEDYLKVVCKIYSEQRAVRVKRVVDRKRLSKLEPDKLIKQKRHNKQSSPTETSNTYQSSEQSQSSQEERTPTKSKHTEERKEEEEEISPEEAQMFEKENAALFEEMTSMSQEVGQIEGKVMEIAKLQEIFTEKVLEQEKDIDRIEQVVVGSTENIKEGNEEIRQAMKNSAGFRVYILFFLLLLTLSLLFLDWYNT